MLFLLWISGALFALGLLQISTMASKPIHGDGKGVLLCFGASLISLLFVYIWFIVSFFV